MTSSRCTGFCSESLTTSIGLYNSLERHPLMLSDQLHAADDQEERGTDPKIKEADGSVLCLECPMPSADTLTSVGRQASLACCPYTRDYREAALTLIRSCKTLDSVTS